jgi:hypothetical protein
MLQALSWLGASKSTEGSYEDQNRRGPIKLIIVQQERKNDNGKETGVLRSSARCPSLGRFRPGVGLRGWGVRKWDGNRGRSRQLDIYTM